MTEARSIRHRMLPIGVWATLMGCASLLVTAPALGASKTVSLNFSAFGDTTYQSDDTGSDWGNGVGASTGLGLGYQSGLSTLGLAYQVSLSKRLGEEFSPSTRLSGSTSYRYTPLSGRWDFSLGHQAQGVSTEENLTIDPDSYSTQQSAQAAAGMNFRPGTVTTMRFAASAGAGFFEDEDLNGQTATARLSLSRRLSKVSSLNASAGRAHSWSASGEESDIDSAQLGYQRSLSNGALGGALGATWVNYEQGEAETVTGNAYRAWQSDIGSTRLAYSRAVSSTLLSTTIPGEFLSPPPGDESSQQEVADDAVLKFQALSVEDSVSLSYQTERLCDRCRFSLSSQLGRREDLKSGDLAHSMGAAMGAGLQISSLQSAGLGYEWQAETEDFGDPIDSQSHQVSLNWQRQLASEWHLRADLSQAWLQAQSDQERFTARLSLNYGINLAGE